MSRNMKFTFFNPHYTACIAVHPALFSFRMRISPYYITVWRLQPVKPGRIKNPL